MNSDKKISNLEINDIKKNNIYILINILIISLLIIMIYVLYLYINDVFNNIFYPIKLYLLELETCPACQTLKVFLFNVLKKYNSFIELKIINIRDIFKDISSYIPLQQINIPILLIQLDNKIYKLDISKLIKNNKLN